MNRRKALRVLGGGAGLAAFAGAKAFAEERENRERGGEKRHDVEMARAAEAIAECSNKCNEGFHHSFEQATLGGKQDFARAAHHLVDCAEICRMTATLTARRSTHAHQVHELCASSCEQTAEACQSLDKAGVPPLRPIIERLRETARLCRNLSKSSEGSPVTR